MARNGTSKSNLLGIFVFRYAGDGTFWGHKDVKLILLQQDTDHIETNTFVIMSFGKIPGNKNRKCLGKYRDENN